MADSKFYPSLTTLIPLENIPVGNLGFIQQGLNVIFKDLYYKDLQIQANPNGGGTFHSLTIVSYKRLALEIPGTDGLALVLNPGIQNNQITEIPISVGFSADILKYVKGFDLNNFSQDPKAFFLLLTEIIGINPQQILKEFIEVSLANEVDAVQTFVDIFNDINDQSISLTGVDIFPDGTGCILR